MDTSVWLVEDMSPFFRKKHRRNGTISHEFTGSGDIEFHDHPFDIEVIKVVEGGYIEEVMNRAGRISQVERKSGDSFIIGARHIHRIIRLTDYYCETLCRYRPWQQEPSFYHTEGGSVMRRQHNQPGWETLR